jgi:starch phosphorylase
VVAVAYDNPIPGYATPTTSNLRLWDAEAVAEFDLTAFNAGDYEKV